MDTPQASASDPAANSSAISSEVGSVVSSDGTTLAYRAFGDPGARPLVLVHGWAQSSESWGFELLTELARDFRVVAPDLRGCGHSDVATAGYDSGAQWADDLAAVLEDARVGPGAGPGAPAAILLGWSYGGVVCADYLAERGTAQIAGLVLCGAVTSIGSGAGGRVGPAMLKVADGAFDPDPKRAISALASFGTAMMRGDDGPGQQRMFGLSLATPPAVRLAMLSRRAEHDETMRGLELPALVVHGADDGVVLPETARANAEMLRGSTLVELSDCAHAPFLEQRTQFCAALREFAAQV